MEPTNYYLAIIEDKSVILDSLMEYFSSSRRFNRVVMVSLSEPGIVLVLQQENADKRVAKKLSVGESTVFPCPNARWFRKK